MYSTGCVKFRWKKKKEKVNNWTEKLNSANDRQYFFKEDFLFDTINYFVLPKVMCVCVCVCVGVKFSEDKMITSWVIIRTDECTARKMDRPVTDQ